MTNDEWFLLIGGFFFLVLYWYATMPDKHPVLGNIDYDRRLPMESHGRHYINEHLCFVGWMPDFEINKCRIQVLDVQPQLLIRLDDDPLIYAEAVEAALRYHASVLQPEKFTKLYYDHLKTSTHETNGTGTIAD